MDEHHHQVRKHIHRLLFGYAKAHLTTDHVAYTLNAVEQLAPAFLKQVPPVDALSLTLPSDPFDVLTRLYDFGDALRYEERFRPVPEATQLVKDRLRTRTVAPKTKQVIERDDPVQLVLEPLSPALSRRSIKVSRSERGASFLSSLPKTLPGLLQDYGLRGLEVESVPEPDVPYERTLKITWNMNADERDEVRNLLKVVTDMRRPQANYKNSVLHAFLHDDSKHQVCSVSCEQQFIPIFPRHRRIAGGNSDLNQKSFCGGHNTLFLQSILPVANLASDDSEDALLQANMETVDGWETFKVSSPSSLSTPTSSQEEERIDQLFMENTPPTDPLTELVNEKLEEYYIPRSRRIGGSFGRNPHILHGKGISDLLPMLRKASEEDTSAPAEPSYPSPISESLVGQPSLVDGVEEPNSISLQQSDDGIESICRNENPTDFIMKARIEGNGTFPVPELPPPNVQSVPKSVLLPINLMDLVTNQEQHRIKKAKGLTSLRLALSWVTFTIDSPLPSHEELIGVNNLFSAQYQEIDDLLDRSFATDRVKFKDREISMPTRDELSITFGEDHGAFFIARSRRDRVGVARSAEDNHFSENDTPRSVKRPRLGSLSKQFVRHPSVTPQFEDLIDNEICSRTGSGPKAQGDMNLDTPIAVVASDSSNSVDTLMKNVVASAESPSSVPPSVCISSQAQQLNVFARLRGKTINSAAQTIESSVNTIIPEKLPEPDEKITTTILNQSTLLLPAFFNAYRVTHKYMASVDFVQRQAIVRALRTGCNVELAERMSLGGVDIIIDPHTCIVVVSLFTLPAHGENVVNLVSQQSWRFRLILVLLEAYPESLSLRPAKTLSDVAKISAFTPPILKAISKLRRDVVIREARQEKSVDSRIEYAIATDPSEAARFIRYLGDLAEEADESGGCLWGKREWLEWEVSADEEALAQMRGMNSMTASIMLCQATAEEIISMSPEERIAAFQPLIGLEVVNAVNEEIEQRLQGMEDFEGDYPSSSELNHCEVSY